MVLQKLLNKHIDKCYDKYKLLKSVSLSKLTELKKSYYSSRNTEKSMYPLVLYIIKNNELDINVYDNDVLHNKDNYKEIKDDRLSQIFEMIRKTIVYALNKKKVVPNTILYFWLSDRIPWYDNIDNFFPIYLFAKPKNTNFILFPDNTFECMTFSEKYEGQCYDWAKTKKIVETKCCNITNKINKMYFKGTPTTRRNSRLRETLEEYSKNSNWLDVNLDAWQNYVSMDNFCKYKFLLNMGGHYPWSNRFKYLFLMNSLVINIDVISINRDNDVSEPAWITFINLIVKPNKHYKNLVMKYYYTKNKGTVLEDARKKNKEEVDTIYTKLEKIYNEKINDETYNNMVKKGYNRVKKLNNKHIYRYVYHCIVKNSEIDFVE